MLVFCLFVKDSRTKEKASDAYDIFFSLRLEESMDEAKELKAMIERTRPDIKCFLSGGNPNSADLCMIISKALVNAKLAIIMGTKTYGKKTESNFSTYEEIQLILKKHDAKKKAMFLLKMCKEWEVPQTQVMMGSRKYRMWEGKVTQALVDEILTTYDQANRPNLLIVGLLKSTKSVVKSVVESVVEAAWPTKLKAANRKLKAVFSFKERGALAAAAKRSSDDPRTKAKASDAYDIFFSLRLIESKDKAEELKAMIERTRPDFKCFLSGGNPNGSDLGIIIPTALANAKLAIIMGTKTYGKKTESNFSTFEEMQFILKEKKEKKFLLKMCEEWEEPQTRVMIGSRKYLMWDGKVTQALVDEILTTYDQANRPNLMSRAAGLLRSAWPRKLKAANRKLKAAFSFKERGALAAAKKRCSDGIAASGGAGGSAAQPHTMASGGADGSAAQPHTRASGGADGSAAQPHTMASGGAEGSAAQPHTMGTMPADSLYLATSC